MGESMWKYLIYWISSVSQGVPAGFIGGPMRQPEFFFRETFGIFRRQNSSNPTEKFTTPTALIEHFPGTTRMIQRKHSCFVADTFV